ncbi:PD40 domain-containing protein [bacterium]|nr:PD40 domain-containing protein [bacterium]
MNKYSNWGLLLIILILLAAGCNTQNAGDTAQIIYPGNTLPGMIPELFAPGLISTDEFNDRDMSFSPDGQQMFFARTKTDKKDDYNYDIMISEWQNDGWSIPEPASFSTPHGELEAFLSPEGSTLYFNSNRPATIESEPEHWETWFTQQTGSGWSEPQLLGAPFQRTCHTTFSRTGKMYYTREDIATLYRVDYKEGVFGQPEELDATLNAVKIQYNSFIAADESYLIFTRHSDDGFGSGDLYVTFRNQKDEWTEPMNLGEQINSPDLDTCPSISLDGKFLFFSSNRRGNMDIYWVDAKVIEELKSHPID